MSKHLRNRRALSIGLIVLGGILLFLAPDNIWIGVVLGIAGIVVELIGIGLAHRDAEKK